MRHLKNWICILLILILLSGCAGNHSSEDFAVSDQLEQSFGAVQDPEPDEEKETPRQPEEDQPKEETPKEDEPTAEEPKEDDPAEEEPNEESSARPDDEEPSVEEDPSEPSEDETPAEKTKISFLSLNIRHSQEVEPNTRAKRLERMGKLFAEYRPAVIGLQEVRPWWMNHLEDTAEGLPDVMPEGYESVCYYRNEQAVKMDPSLNESAKEGCVIFYDTAVVTKLEEGVFWLSTHPNVESKYEEAGNYRIAVWAKFEINATGEEFYFYSTHLDTVASTQIPAINCLKDQAAIISKKHGEAPIVVCGDFNLLPQSEPYAELQKYYTDAAAVAGVETTTFPNWGHNAWEKNYRIDYFVSQGTWTPVRYEVDTRVFNPNTEEAVQLDFKPEKHAYGYYSDHAPLYAEYQFN